MDISGIYLGAEEAKQWCREWFTAREALDFEHQSLDAGEQVVTLLDLRMRGRTSGVEVTLGKHAWVITFRRGLMLRVELYMSQADALKAAVPLQPRHAGRPNV